ncbi:uncharacterized protein LOC130947772 isoform X1 [Arachis stenosperma]|uniref:uncharacterized protein LOC130947772 isoform X1 n=1 Tax=Arachis stenosperma TaxID=217475 RepID=UPI0025ACA9A3|nr:uncharacterized protein LOC130947772 isoform X1 [Arachis stenosperma]XP_057732459.1 uncharacterized protein LOC130947772 isoform X1 [Arachis stenosperma]
MPSNKRLKVTASTTEKSSLAVPPSRSSAQPIPSSCGDLCPVLPARKDPHSSLPTPGDARPLTLVFESGVHHPLGSSSVPCHESINSDDDAESFDEHVATISCGSRKNNDYWKVNVIDDKSEKLSLVLDQHNVIEEAKLKVDDVLSLPAGRKVILTCNEHLQPIGDAGGLLSGFLGILGSDYKKFPIYLLSWRKVPRKDDVYNDIIKRKFHFVDVENKIKRYMLKNLGKVWKDTRHRLFHQFYDHTLSIEENIARRPSRIDENHWRWFIDYRLSKKTREICKKNAENRKKQLFTHTGGSKSIARRKDEEERQCGRRISRGEMWTIVHKRKDGSYIHNEAQVIGEKITSIERDDASSKALSQNDSLFQALGKEHLGRVRGVGSGPCPTQLFGQSTHQLGRMSSSVNHDIQVEMNVIKSQLEASRLQVQNLETEMKQEKLRRQALEKAVKFLIELQGSNLPPEIASVMNAFDSDKVNGPVSPGARPSSSASHDAQNHESDND